MRAYVVTTGVIFALIVVVHLWRIVAESHDLATDPAFVLLTAACAALSAWAARLARRAPSA